MGWLLDSLMYQRSVDAVKMRWICYALASLACIQNEGCLMFAHALAAIASSARKAWNGEEKLWIAFWGWFVLLELIVIIFNKFTGTTIVEYMYSIVPSLSIAWLNVAFCMCIAYFLATLIFHTRVIWKCAPNTHKKKWFYTARIFASSYFILILAALINLCIHVTLRNFEH